MWIEFIALTAVLGLLLSNFLWLRHIRFIVITAISRTPQEFTQRLHAVEDKKPGPPKEKRPRPEGL